MNDENFLFYDLETNGLDYYTTGIMQITLMDVNGNILMNEYVYPYDNRIDGVQIHGIDQNVLYKNHAITTKAMLEKLKSIIKEYYEDKDIYIIAYNNFMYDQVILENNFKICEIEMPMNWYFIDLYPIVKELYPLFKPNYKLKTVYENFFGQNNNIMFHNSLGDVLTMYEIYKKIKEEYRFEFLVNKYTRSSLKSPKIYDYYVPVIGINDERIKVQNIMDSYKNECYSNKLTFEDYLKHYMKIHNSFIVKNIIKQLQVIEYFEE